MRRPSCWAAYFVVAFACSVAAQDRTGPFRVPLGRLLRPGSWSAGTTPSSPPGATATAGRSRGAKECDTGVPFLERLELFFCGAFEVRVAPARSGQMLHSQVDVYTVKSMGPLMKVPNIANIITNTP